MKVEVDWQKYGTLISIDGVWMGIDDWSREMGLSPIKVRYRLRMGWTVEEALELTKRSAKRVNKPKGRYRMLTDKERAQRGCLYCMDVVTTGKHSTYYAGRYCPHEQCPYRELDRFEDYERYIRETDLKGFAKALAGLGLTVEEEEE